MNKAAACAVAAVLVVSPVAGAEKICEAGIPIGCPTGGVTADNDLTHVGWEVAFSDAKLPENWWLDGTSDAQSDGLRCTFNERIADPNAVSGRREVGVSLVQWMPKGACHAGKARNLFCCDLGKLMPHFP